jgi:hypothetical protein
VKLLPANVPCHRSSEDNVHVKPDAEYLKRLLSAFRNAPKPTTDIEELKEAGIDYEEPVFEFHMCLLVDGRYIESTLGPGDFGMSRGVDGYVSWSVIPLRLTAAGHEFAEGLENTRAFETVRKDFVGASISTIRDVVVGVIKAEIGRHTGLHF